MGTNMNGTKKKHINASNNHSKGSERRALRILLPAALIACLLIVSLAKALGVKKMAGELKQDMKNVAAAFISMDCEKARTELQTMDEQLDSMEQELDKPFWRLMNRMPLAGKELLSARTLLSVAETASDEMMKPGLELLESYPLSELLHDRSHIDETFAAYSAYYRSAMPRVRELTEQLEDVHLRFADRDGKITGYIDMALALEPMAEKIADELIEPSLDFVERTPLSTLKTEEGINYMVLAEYLRFADSMLPGLKENLAFFDAPEIREIDKEGRLQPYVVLTRALADIGSEGIGKLLIPAAEFLPDHDPSGIALDGGYNAGLILSYMDFAESVVPDAKKLLSELSELDFSMIDKEGKLDALFQKLDSLMEGYNSLEQYFPLARVVLGSGEDRHYLFAAQNSAEIRASGGFPGSVGSMSIENGVLRFGDFLDVYHTMYSRTVTPGVEPDLWEFAFFGDAIYLSWDSVHDPDFSRVAEIWVDAAQPANEARLDGAISLTPSIIQDMLDVFGPIELTGGIELNGENATRMIEHDIYTRIYKRGGSTDLYAADSIFSEIVKKTVERIGSVLDGEEGKTELANKLFRLVTVFEKHRDDRTLLLWFRDRDEQRVCREFGCDGGLNRDRNKPEAGIYFSGITPSKMGWWTDIDPIVSEGTRNADGSVTYPVSVTFRHSMTAADMEEVNDYVYGNRGGEYEARITLFAPAGGSISDPASENRLYFGRGVYKDLQLIYLPKTFVPGESMTISYSVTTAPGVDAPLGLSMTPTLQNYR